MKGGKNQQKEGKRRRENKERNGRTIEVKRELNDEKKDFYLMTASFISY